MNNNNASCSKVINDDFKECGLDDVVDGRAATQEGWYMLASKLLQGDTVLDIGAGLGAGIPLLKKHAKEVKGQDIDPRLATKDIMIAPLSDFSENSFDSICCIDVIEHIKEDLSFLKELQRIARKKILISTPNWTASRCHWEHHVREYTPRQLYNLVKNFGKVDLYKGVPSGHNNYKVKFLGIYFLFNDLRNNFFTAFFARALNIVLPPKYKINSHLFVVITKSS